MCVCARARAFMRVCILCACLPGCVRVCMRVCACERVCLCVCGWVGARVRLCARVRVRAGLANAPPPPYTGERPDGRARSRAGTGCKQRAAAVMLVGKQPLPRRIPPPPPPHPPSPPTHPGGHGGRGGEPPRPSDSGGGGSGGWWLTVMSRSCHGHVTVMSRSCHGRWWLTAAVVGRGWGGGVE